MDDAPNHCALAQSGQLYSIGLVGAVSLSKRFHGLLEPLKRDSKMKEVTFYFYSYKDECWGRGNGPEDKVVAL